MSTKSSLILFLILALSLGSCKKQDEIRIKLTSRERALIDTMYLERVQELRPMWDSICLATHDSLLEIALDSIIRVRRLEEAKLRSRLTLPEK
ncbi:hypothetical protein [Flavilitoribacter nigricans]|uniref:Uncharacterized protein n=1 Tax=Flavilitoribacter nigricans (strain ATCC 23147 / DSM 23189 / NBRC 102662 / NCIMB 1420 / SS-2) TaxID=1122177 RepID=A0A2D0NG03_FLAN2|nr:hypothetical protein [Flavilitoribacter nigricans]PHN07434.1 hypothetical protein CRP01_07345 [Flavilitoribacter nigricans DSM 23189 = NBRC 102662]